MTDYQRTLQLAKETDCNYQATPRKIRVWDGDFCAVYSFDRKGNCFAMGLKGGQKRHKEFFNLKTNVR